MRSATRLPCGFGFVAAPTCEHWRTAPPRRTRCAPAFAPLQRRGEGPRLRVLIGSVAAPLGRISPRGAPSPLIARASGSSSGDDLSDGEERARADTASEVEGEEVADDVARSYSSELESIDEGAPDGGEGGETGDELAKSIAELAKQKRMGEQLNLYGQRLYESGEYQGAIVAFEESITLISKDSEIGGEAQLWLCLSYDAGGEREKALALYKNIEATHPMARIRQQAANLRYILEAPKIKITKDERVVVPNLDEVDSIRDRQMKVMNNRRRKKIELTMEERVLQEWSPKVYVPNKYVLFAATVLTLGLAWYVSFVLSVV